MTTASRSKWETIDSKNFARGIFLTVKGNCPLLEVDYSAANSIWQKVVHNLGIKRGTRTDRYWAEVSWKTNKDNVQEQHEQTCRLLNIEYVKPIRYASSDRVLAERNCICAKPFEKSIDESMVACYHCENWFHYICLGIRGRFGENDNWTCPNCAQHTTDGYVIPLFRSQYTGNREKIIDSEEAASEDAVSEEDYIPKTSTPITKRQLIMDPNVSACRGSMANQQKNSELVVKKNPSALQKSKVQAEFSEDEENSIHSNSDEEQFENDKKPPTFGSFERGNDNETTIVRPTVQSRASKEVQALSRSHIDEDIDNDSATDETTGHQHSGTSIHVSDSDEYSDIRVREIRSSSSSLNSVSTSASERIRRKPTEGPITSHKAFPIRIQWTDWVEIKPKEAKHWINPQLRFRLVPGRWTNVFHDSFMKSCTSAMKGCVLSFKSHVVNPAGKTFLRATSICKRNKCSMRYVFLLKKSPTQGEIVVSVSPNGTLLHDLTEVGKRHLQGLRRIEMQKKLSRMSASILRRKLYGAVKDDQALEKGNLTETSTLTVLQGVRKEARTKDDLSKDILQDLVGQKLRMDKFEHLQGKLVKGYIQNISLFPFYMVMYTERQLDLLKRVLHYNENAVLHLDATGKVICKLPPPYRGKIQLYYALVVTFPGSKESPLLPVMEFIMNVHSAAEISHVLHMFFIKYREVSKTSKRCFGVRRIETDKSLALVSAVLQALEIGPLHVYVADCWKALVSANEMYYVHHVCRKHALDYIKAKVQTCYGRNSEGVTLFKTWTNAFLQGRDLWSFSRRVLDVLLICGRPTMTESIKSAIRNIGRPTSREGTPPWNFLELANVPNYPPFYQQSPFGYFALAECARVRVQVPEGVLGLSRRPSLDNDSEEESMQNVANPFYNTDLLKYFLKHVFPIACLLDHSLLYLNKMSLTPDTNAPSESWNDILKVDESKEVPLPCRAGRFTIRQEGMLRGRIQMADKGLLRSEREKELLKNKHPATTKSKEPSEAKLQQTELKNKQRTKGSLAVQTARKSTSGVPKQGEKYYMEPKITIMQTTVEETPKHNVKSFKKRANETKTPVPEMEEEGWGPKKGIAPNRGDTKTAVHSVRRIPWGGTILMNEKQLDVRNTCSIDNCLQIFYTLFKTEESVAMYIKVLADGGNVVARTMLQTFQALDSGNFMDARRLVLVEVMNFNPINFSGDVYGSENSFLESISNLVQIIQHRRCVNKHCNAPRVSDIFPLKDFHFSNINALERYFLKKYMVCDCKKDTFCTVWAEFAAFGPPPFLAFSLGHSQTLNFQEYQVPKSVMLSTHKFRTFAYTVNLADHFYTVFKVNRKLYIYDGIRHETLRPHTKAPDGHAISTIWFIRDSSSVSRGNVPAEPVEKHATRIDISAPLSNEGKKPDGQKKIALRKIAMDFRTITAGMKSICTGAETIIPSHGNTSASAHEDNFQTLIQHASSHPSLQGDRFDLKKRKSAVMSSLYENFELKAANHEKHKRAVSNLTNTDMAEFLQIFAKDMREILKGKLKSNRLLLLRKGTPVARKQLNIIMATYPFPNHIMSNLVSLFMGMFEPDIDKRVEWADIIKFVLIPELLIRVFAQVNNISVADAENEMLNGAWR